MTRTYEFKHISTSFASWNTMNRPWTNDELHVTLQTRAGWKTGVRRSSITVLKSYLSAKCCLKGLHERCHSVQGQWGVEVRCGYHCIDTRDSLLEGLSSFWEIALHWCITAAGVIWKDMWGRPCYTIDEEDKMIPRMPQMFSCVQSLSNMHKIVLITWSIVSPIVDPGRNLDVTVSWSSEVRIFSTRSRACWRTVVDTNWSWMREEGLAISLPFEWDESTTESTMVETDMRALLRAQLSKQFF